MPQGRNRSPAALSVVPAVIPGQGRPEPPVDLDSLEAEVWREVIAALPAHWVDPAGQLILRRLAAQSAVALRLEERLRQLRAQEHALARPDRVQYECADTQLQRRQSHLLGSVPVRIML
jgi:hypothetical protein